MGIYEGFGIKKSTNIYCFKSADTGVLLWDKKTNTIVTFTENEKEETIKKLNVAIKHNIMRYGFFLDKTYYDLSVLAPTMVAKEHFVDTEIKRWKITLLEVK